jgi:hypothetical protein
MVEKFQKAGVRAIFAGHYHRNAGGKYENMEIVVTSAIGAQSPTGRNAKSGYRVVYVDEKEIRHEYVDINGSHSNIVFEVTFMKIFSLLCLGFIIKNIIN